MGLDMYLTKKIYVGAEYEHRKVKGIIDIKVGEEKLNIDFKKVSYIEERAGYWRKANQIHNWFVENVQDGEDNCGTYYVDQEQLQNLLDLVNRILEEVKLIDGKVYNGTHYENGVERKIFEDGKIISNPEICEELLPTSSGFFFGGTDYDEYYYQDLLDTKEILENCLRDKDGEFYYHSSW